MEVWNGKVAIVTGASAGIGKAIASKLVEEGMKVAGLARRKERVEELAASLKKAKGELHAIRVDLTKEEDILNAFEYVIKNLGPIHVLVNNAGLNHASSLCSGKTKDWKQILETNTLALSIATREAIQNMIANDVDGHIIHINSVAGHPLSHTPATMYGASKYALTSLTESLRIELNAAKSKIKVTSISPGHVLTEFLDALSENSDGKVSKEDVKLFRQHNPALKPEDVADSVLYVLETPRHVQVHELIIKPIGEDL
ncbi:hypothetical protein RI129_005546 [Pyrocoelia pectoralis]|uniref:Dehydrogenase/reductase SDR family member 11 n=1 Tax=Pyrocoelia pectoralis TaxID=417401 RepID=A0AAN7VFT9_9COLE